MPRTDYVNGLQYSFLMLSSKQHSRFPFNFTFFLCVPHFQDFANTLPHIPCFSSLILLQHMPYLPPFNTTLHFANFVNCHHGQQSPPFFWGKNFHHLIYTRWNIKILNTNFISYIQDNEQKCKKIIVTNKEC